MARRFETLYRMKDGVTRLAEKYFNAVFGDIDLRLGSLEDVKADWVQATNDIASFGLKRIDEVLLPAFEQVQQLADSGFLVAQADPAAGTISFVEGAQGLSIAAGPVRNLFTPTPFVVLTRESTANDWAIAEVLSYDKTTGLLSFNIIAVNGAAGPHTDVWVAASGGSEIAARQFLAQAEAARDNAVSSASTASTAATAAAAAQTQIAAFNKQYLGAKTANPTVDNSGGALQIGAFYWNTTTNTLMIYGSGGWVSASSAVTGISNTQTWTATAGQTTFAVTGGYDPDRVLVFLNGVKQVNGTDVTVSSGTNLVFASALSAGDIVDLMAFGSFQLASVLAKVQNLADVPNKDTALANLGGGTKGIEVFKGSTAEAIRTALSVSSASDVAASVLAKVQNLADIPNKNTALANLGGGTKGIEVFKGSTAEAIRTALSVSSASDVASKADAAEVAATLALKAPLSGGEPLFETLRFQRSYNLATAADLNALSNSGWYDVQNPTNGPAPGWCWVHCQTLSADPTHWRTQRAISLIDGREYVRSMLSGTWGAWVEVNTAGHTHVAANITDFSSAVAALSKMVVLQDTTVGTPVAYVEHSVDFSVYAYAVTIVRGISGTAAATLQIYTRNSSVNRDGVISSQTFAVSTTQCVEVFWSRSGFAFTRYDPYQESVTDVNRIRFSYSTGNINAGRIITYGVKF